MQDFFKQEIALNDLTGTILANAAAQVYAMEDTAFETPLAITDMSGSPMATLRSSPTGFYPAFIIPSGETQVIARSGAALTPLVSFLGHLLALLPNPDGEADQLTIVTQSGEYVLAPMATTPIPDPTLGDDDQVLAIKSGQWAIADPTGGGGTVGGILDGGAP